MLASSITTQALPTLDGHQDFGQLYNSNALGMKRKRASSDSSALEQRDQSSDMPPWKGGPD